MLASGTNFAPTGWSTGDAGTAGIFRADAIGLSPMFKCVLNPLNPLNPLNQGPNAWSEEYHLPEATFVDYTTAVCNISAGLYECGGDAFRCVGDVTLGVTIKANQYNSRYQPGVPFTFYDPDRPPTVVDEVRASYQPGFLEPFSNLR